MTPRFPLIYPILLFFTLSLSLVMLSTYIFCKFYFTILPSAFTALFPHTTNLMDDIRLMTDAKYATRWAMMIFSFDFCFSLSPSSIISACPSPSVALTVIFILYFFFKRKEKCIFHHENYYCVLHCETEINVFLIKIKRRKMCLTRFFVALHLRQTSKWQMENRVTSVLCHGNGKYALQSRVTFFFFTF